jgi:ribonucleotide reductase alpha subunit
MPTLTLPRYAPFYDGLETIECEFRDARITAGERVIFEQPHVWVPKTWSQNALNIAAQKYLRVVYPHDASQPGSGQKEASIPGMMNRIVETLANWGVKDGYFAAGSDERDAFGRELVYLLLSQRAAFNSPVFFNLGVTANPVCSACFIVGVDDNMNSILDLVRTEGTIFKNGAGIGLNGSTLRSRREKLSGGGTASGPVSFMKGLDSMCGVIKAGGTTRRAAVMRILDCDHLDLLDFVTCKVHEERKARALLAMGFEASLDKDLTFWQNSNISVRVTDAFMSTVTAGGKWVLRGRHSPDLTEEHDARALLHQIAAATHECGDPGMQFHDTINRMHTCPSLGLQVASNPCFTGDTLVDTAEGFIRFDELERRCRQGDELPLAFSFSRDDSLPVLRPIQRVWISKRTRKLVKITTDKGIALTCTPDHKFLLRNGAYVAAKDLRPGARLRKIGRSVNAQRAGRHYLNHRTTASCPNGTEWQARWMWEQVNGPIPAGHEVHHKNEDQTDDRLSNFELRVCGEHQAEHSAGSGNPRFIDVSPETLVDLWEEIEGTPKLTRTDCPEQVTPARWNAQVKAHGLSGRVPLANMHGIRGQTWAEFAQWISAQREGINDRVRSVKRLTLERKVPVYDLTVADTHNFAVTSEGADGVHSVIVKNCGEFLWLDYSACNLASLNLLAFYDPETGSFDVAGFQRAVRLMVIAQDLIATNSTYPDPRIAETVRQTRTIGLGYSNLGALLLNMKLPYDSEDGRAVAAAITAVLTGTAYQTSHELARCLGAFPAWADQANRDAMLEVLDRHEAATRQRLLRDLRAERHAQLGGTQLFATAAAIFTNVIQQLSEALPAGMRNAQVSVLAPTGTIGFVMDCETTGVEPLYLLTTTKTLVGGGTLTVTPASLPRVLQSLGYSAEHVGTICRWVEASGEIVDAPHFDPQHLPIFATAVGKNAIAPRGHLQMLAAVQPFISGGISKTVNLPTTATVEDVEQCYLDAWRLGIKAVALYRNGSKALQPMSGASVTPEKFDPGKPLDPKLLAAALQEGLSFNDLRKRLGVSNDATDLNDYTATKWGLPDEIYAVRYKFQVGNVEGYLHVGMFPGTNRPGEIFIRLAKVGSTLAGLLDSFARAASNLLQHGVPLEVLCRHYKHTKFEPCGMTGSREKELKFADSIIDHIFRWLEQRYIVNRKVTLVPTVQLNIIPRPPTRYVAGMLLLDETPVIPDDRGHIHDDTHHHHDESDDEGAAEAEFSAPRTESTGDICSLCGAMLRVTGTCRTCPNCGDNSGCG